MNEQSLIIRLPANLARAIHQLLDAPESPYASLSELARVALENQLAVELGENERREWRRQGSSTAERLQRIEPPAKSETRDRALGRPSSTPAPGPDPDRDNRPLFSLTNRLAPVKVGLRAAILLASQAGDWPTKPAFDVVAAEAARRLGLELRADDDAHGRRGPDRRWIGFPVGDDADGARARFLVSFAFSTEGIPGPYSVLRLASLNANRVVLTDAGVQLAMSPSPLLGETDGFTLGADEKRVLGHQIALAPAEKSAILTFSEAVRQGAGVQGAIDHALQSLNPDWSDKQAVAHRAAMLGRLRDLGLASVEGRGPTASIGLAPEVLDVVGAGVRA